MSFRQITLCFFVFLFVSLPVISSGEINLYSISGDLSDEEMAAINELASVFNDSSGDLTLHKNSTDADSGQDATMKVMEIRKKWKEWNPAFKEIAGSYFLSKSSSVFGASLPKYNIQGAKAVRGTHLLPNWVETEHFSIEWGNNLFNINDVVNSINIISCSGDYNTGSVCSGIPDLVDRWADYFEEAWIREVSQLGYIKPAGTDNYLYDVYIANSKDNIAGNSDDMTPALSYNYLGLTITYCDKDYFQICKEDATQDSYSYIVVNNSSNEQTMKITAAHEFFHAIQFSYPSIDAWWATPGDHWWIEATATWMEEEVYDEVNNYYSKIRSWLLSPKLSLKDTGTSYSGHEYGDAIFVLYLTDVYLNNKDFVKDVWENQKSGIDSLNTVLATDKYGNRDFESAFRGFIALNAVADIGQASGGYEEGSEYGRARVTRLYRTYPATLSVSGDAAPYELGSNYIHFLPPDNDNNSLTIEFNGAANINWATMIVKVRSDGIGYEVEDLIIDPLLKSGCNSIEGFGSVYNEVFLVASVLLEPGLEDTAPYNYRATIGNNCTETPVQAYSVSEYAAVSDVNSNKTDKRCFIATVAFGSSDSPFVKILRDFRDNYLMTNRFGRQFVTIYYSISPSIADFLEQHPPAPVIVRYALMPVIGIAYLLLNITFQGKAVIALFTLSILTLSAYKSLIKRQ